jgi:uncharacterized protein YbcV (DUF1398 family)
MSEFYFIVKDGKYLTAGAKYTDNVNLAYLYKNKDEAEYIAGKTEGVVLVKKSRKWVVVKDDMYLSTNNKFIKDIKKAYIFNKSTAEQYARELKGAAVESL